MQFCNFLPRVSSPLHYVALTKLTFLSEEVILRRILAAFTWFTVAWINNISFEINHIDLV